MLDREGEREPPGDERILRYVWFRDQLRTLLLIEATLLSVQIIGTAAMRNAVVAGSSEMFPQGWVVLFGAFYTSPLALAYGPTHLRLLGEGRSVRDEFFPPRVPGANDWTDWYDARGKFGEFLELQAPGAPAFRVIAAIMSPFLTSIVTTVLERSG